MTMTRHTHIGKITLTLLTIALLFGGCRKSYPGIEYIDEKIQLDEQFEKIPIIVAVDDPLMITTSRGVGPLDDEEETLHKWLETRFHVYAFLAHNSKYDGPIDYRAMMNPSDEEDVYCLVSDTLPNSHGKPARINFDQGMRIAWEDEDEILYYNLQYQDYRYNFFAYHIDDAQINEIKKSRDHVELDLTIDGSQDLMLGVASPTEEQIKALCEDSKWTAARIHDLAYSTTTGHRDVVPVITMKHLLSRFSFKLTGKDEESDSVSVRNIYVKAKNRGLMTVAADDTTRINLTFPDSLNPALKDWPLIYLPIMEDDTIRTTGFTQKYRVSYGETQIIGEDLLLPAGLPIDQPYTLVLECEYKDEHGRIHPYKAAYTLTLGNGRPFEPGVKYVVNVNVYGMQEISIMIENIGWILSPIEIDLGEEDLLPFD